MTAAMGADAAVTPGQAIVLRKSRPLFAFHHQPHEAMQRSVAVVMCPALGFESLSAYRTYRHAAEHLAARGFHVLRFDYFGTGNSDGDAEAAANLVADIHAAADELKQLANVSSLCLFGTRAGALLAAQAAAERQDVVSLILLAAPASGRAYVREQKVFQMMSANTASDARDSLNVAGFTFSAAMVQELGKIDLAKLAMPSSPKILILGRDDIADDGRLLRHFSEAGCQVRQVALAGYAAMMATVEISVVPKRLLLSAFEWLEEVHPEMMERYGSATHAALPMQTSANSIALTEEGVRFGPEQRLFGVVTKPAATAGSHAKQQAVLLLSVGANHHIGSGRAYVTLARELAALGVTVLRFDVSGLGESYAASGKAENIIYDPDSIADIEVAMQFLAQHYDIKEFILGGVCLGAHLAFYAAPLNKNVSGLVLVNLAVFELQPPVTDEKRTLKSFKSRETYIRAFFDMNTWRRLFKGQVAARDVFRHLVNVYFRVAMTTLKRYIFATLRINASVNSVELSMRGTLKRGVRVSMVYSKGDPALDGFALNFGSNAERVSHAGKFELHLVAGADHAFSQPDAQRQLRALMCEFVRDVP